MKRTIRCLVTVVATVIAVPAASAQDPAPTKEQIAAAKVAFNEGNTLYKAGKLVEAVEKIKESYRLSRNPILLFNIGRIYDQLGQKDQVLVYYRQFLTDAPATAPMHSDVTKRVAELEQEAATVAPPDPDPEPPPTKTTPIEFQHTPVFTTTPGTQVELTAVVPADSGYTVTLFYRGSGDETFTSEPMRWQGKVLVGHIPAAKVSGNWVQYYLEVRDRDGKLLTRAGKSTSPNLVNVETTTPVITSPVQEDPLLAPPRDEKPRVPIRPGKWIASGAAVGLLGGAVFMYTRAANEHDILVFDTTSCGTPPCREFDAAYAQKVESRGILYDRLYKVSLGLGIGAAGVAGYLWYREMKAAKPGEVQMAVTPSFGDGFTGAAFAARF